MKKPEIDINNLPPINKRLYEFIIKSSGSVYAFSKNIGLSQPRVNSFFHLSGKTGKYPSIQSDVLESILKKYNLNTNWLFTGEGEMFKNISGNSEALNIQIPTVPEIDKKELSSASPLFDIIKNQGEALKEIALNRDSKHIEEIALIKKEIEALKEILKNQSAEFRTLYNKLNELISANNISEQKKVS